MRGSRLSIGLVLAALVFAGIGCRQAIMKYTGQRTGEPAAAPAAVQPGNGPVPSSLGEGGSQEPGGNEAPLIVGGDRDAHGCIGSAGYTWCAAKEKCLRSWEEECFASAAEGVRYALAEKYDKSLDDVIVSVDQENDGFARGSVRYGVQAPVGGAFLSAKFNGQWLLVYDGNGSIDCDQIRKKYEFPAAMLEGFCDAESGSRP